MPAALPVRPPEPPPGLPARITGFGLGVLTPALLAVLEALGRHVDVHLFQFNPCREFWGDIVDARTLARWRLLSPAQSQVVVSVLAWRGCSSMCSTRCSSSNRR